MKKTFPLLLASLLGLYGLRAEAQTDTAGHPWFDQLTIAQSMATTEQQALPAQFNITFPKSSPASFLVNIGAGYTIASLGPHSILSAIAEYHRNTLTDSVQNNLQLGVKFNIRLGVSQDGGSSYFLIADPQYSWDGVAKKNSIESNLLIAPKWTLDPFNIGKPTQRNDRRRTFFFSLYGGTQLQQVFPSDTTQAKGFKLRPLITGIASYSFNRAKNVTDPLLTIFVSYSQRKTVVNTTEDGENFTHLLNTGINYFLIAKPVKVSIGASFVEGSDYFSGQKPEQYFLISLNLTKAPKATGQ